MRLEPTRIRLARERAALSRSALAASLGICEQELARAPEGLSRALADVLGCAPQFFQLPATQAIDTERIFFRSPRRTSTAHKVAAAALGRNGVELYNLITSNFQLPHTEVPELSGYDPEDAAAEIRQEWDLGCGELPNILHLLESRGIRVLSLPSWLDEVKTFSFWEDGQAFIFLASGSRFEQRLALAHELGHLLMHSSLGQNREQLGAAEREADEFAVRLLLPSLSLQVRVSNSLQIPQLLLLQEHYGISAKTILTHARACGVLDEVSYQWLAQELALEPVPAHHQVTSKVFSIVFPSLQLDHRSSTAKIARELGLRAQQVHELTFGQAFVLLEGSHEPGESARGHLHAL